MLNFANSDHNFDVYSPEEYKYDSYEEISEVQKHTINKEKSDMYMLNRNYHKRFLYFVPRSSIFYEFDTEHESFNNISTQSDIINLFEVQTTELPDGSYLLTGGRDGTIKKIQMQLFNIFKEPILKDHILFMS